ncbi:alpha/beta fold hydrolase [Mycobacterium sp. CBMA293]|uniref:alpha/beta fold hydrolase n=2 Tax=Mycolicibacterium TaxID=1866885 RepID=UPI0012DE2DDF|nr:MULTISPECIES: alpha/beta hydrolase [unclassified Mycolicibacterium]MUM31854.1 alpha/beta fold hydrolase [Mycolicibacterium sp. CBMA 361]MUL46085.1 alpha/beta fold hydrolase [Mycolicibacterium sp. CBMA 360]MUL58866.1 alpha/beta fold hydrolase [Mycolicibacterium sp. CBMA 335]MUL69260.1 alpha/beta fold hydrolase [Mycolicibacterium sp. CBMA 311]MUL94224.1 alpha/beta fold hydrolase [Mycolicibacterium sp. CBMA 230]
MTGHSEQSTGRTLEIDGHSVHYHDVGAGPPLVMPQAFGPLPGTTAWLTYHRVLDELAAEYRCVLVDYPNFGRSGPREFHEPVHDLYVRNTFGILDHLGLDSVTALGISTGGTVALGMAMAAPERVTRLIVGGCTASTGGDPYLLAAAPTEVGRLFDECQTGMPERERIARLLRSLVFDPGLIGDDLVERMYQWRVDEPEHAEAWSRSTIVPRSNLAALRAVDVPTLVIHGRHDRMVPMEGALQLLGHLPTSDLLVLNKCGHWPPYERPRDFVRAVTAFLTT